MKYPFKEFSSFVNSKIYEAPLLKKHLDEIQSGYSAALKPTIATLNGSFDLLHAGHLYILYEASQVADILVVALNSDASIKRYKEKSRPIIPLQQRMEMIGALACVDFVTWFDEDDPRDLISLIKPNFHVNGKEYGEECIEAKIVKSVGAKLHLINRIGTFSTSEVLKKIQKLPPIL